MRQREKLRVAIVHDWLYTLGGAEKVLAAIFACFPKADLFCLFDFLDSAQRKKIGYETSQASFLQHMPGIRHHHRAYLPLMPLAIEQLNLADYDLIISSNYAVAKGVLTGPDQIHVAYIHSPMRYAWDLQHQYLKEAKLERGVKSWLTRFLLHHIRIWDVRTGSGPDAYIANSHFIARRVRKIYGREAQVIYPPVHVPETLGQVRKGRHFLTASRLVAYKNTHCVIDAFKNLPHERLIVVGDGPELNRLRAIAGPNVDFKGFVPDAELRQLMATARAFLFAAEEDFGITPVEAQGQGTPVLALGRGGARETVSTCAEAPTGLFFDEPDPAAILRALQLFMADEDRFTPAACHRNALRFAEAEFKDAFTAFVSREIDIFQRRLDQTQPATSISVQVQAAKAGQSYSSLLPAAKNVLPI